MYIPDTLYNAFARNVEELLLKIDNLKEYNKQRVREVKSLTRELSCTVQEIADLKLRLGEGEHFTEERVFQWFEGSLSTRSRKVLWNERVTTIQGVLQMLDKADIRHCGVKTRKEFEERLKVLGFLLPK